MGLRKQWLTSLFLPEKSSERNELEGTAYKRRLIGVILVGVSLTLTAFPVPVNPEIGSPPVITSGSSAVLSWSVNTADTITIDQGIGDVSASGSVVVAPPTTTTYTLTASNESSTISRTANVQVTESGLAPSTIRIAPNGRYFLGTDNEPFFWLGDTAWRLFQDFSQAEAETYLQRRAEQGFTVIHPIAIGWCSPELTSDTCSPEFTDHNIYGHRPLINNDFTSPNPEFFDNVDYIVNLARQKGLTIAFHVVNGHHYVNAHGFLNASNARQYGYWLGDRYANTPNIVWVLGGDTPPGNFTDVYRELAAGLREGEKSVPNGLRHLITYHPRELSSQALQNESWLDFHMIQTWASYDQVNPRLSSDYSLTSPRIRPTGIGEGMYEDEGSYPNGLATPLILRKQAYWSYLSGGYYTYGNSTVINRRSDWVNVMDSPGAQHLVILQNFFTSLPWSSLVPDQSMFVQGVGSGTTLNAAARAGGNDMAVVYLSNSTTVTLNLSKLNAGPNVSAIWVNPQTGSQIFGGNFSTASQATFTTPVGYEDAVLLLKIADVASDTTPPAVSLTAPIDGSTISGTVSLDASASDDVAVSTVEFYANGSLLGSDSTAPYFLSFNTQSVPNGSHTFTARAVDASGNSTTTSPITATVTNPSTASFSANPQTITSGSSATLSWTTANAATVSIDQGIGSVAASGSLAVTPSVTTTYILTATGSGGTATSQVTLNVTPPPQCVAWPSGLLHFWPADGTTADVVGSGSGTGASVNYITGLVGSAFSFTGGSSNTYVRLPASVLKAAYSSFTIEFWVNPTSHGWENLYKQYGYTILSHTDTDGFAFRLNNGYLQADVRLSGSEVLHTFSQTQVPLNTWSHVALTYDGSMIHAYINGVQVGSLSASGTVRNGYNSSTTPMIGNEPLGSAVQDRDFGFRGAIDELAFHNRALSSGEIVEIYDAAGKGKCQSEAPNTSARHFYYAESDTESTSKSTVYQDKTSLTFFPDDNSTYLYLGSYQTNTHSASSTGYQNRFLDTAGAVRARGEMAPGFFSTYRSFPIVASETFGPTPGQKTARIQYRSDGNWDAKIKNARLMALKLGENDRMVSSDGPQGISSTAFVSLTPSLAFTPSSGGDYLIIAYTEFDEFPGELAGLHLDVDGVKYGVTPYLYDQGNATSRQPVIRIFKVNLSPASHTINMQARVGNGTVVFHNSRIMALALSDFGNVYYSESLTRSTTTSTSYQDKAMLTATPLNLSHLVLAWSEVDSSSNVDQVYWKLVEGTIDRADYNARPRGVQADDAFTMYVKTLPAVPTTWRTQFKSNTSTTTAGVKDNVIAVLQLE